MCLSPSWVHTGMPYMGDLNPKHLFCSEVPSKAPQIWDSCIVKMPTSVWALPHENCNPGALCPSCRHHNRSETLSVAQMVNFLLQLSVSSVTMGRGPSSVFQVSDFRTCEACLPSSLLSPLSWRTFSVGNRVLNNTITPRVRSQCTKWSGRGVDTAVIL